MTPLIPKTAHGAEETPLAGFFPVSRNGLQGWIAEGIPADLFDDFLCDPEHMLASPVSEILKDGSKTKVARTHLAGRSGARTVVIKRFHYAAARRRLGFYFLASPAERALRSALLLKEHGFDTAEPLAAFRWRHWAKRGTSYYIAESIEGDCSVRGLWLRQSRRRPPQVRYPVIRGLAELLARLHRAGLYHRDFKGSNILLRNWPNGGAQFVLIDLDVRRARRGLSARRRAKNLLQVRLAWSMREKAYFYLRYARLYCDSRAAAKSLTRRMIAGYRASRAKRSAAGIPRKGGA